MGAPRDTRGASAFDADFVGIAVVADFDVAAFDAFAFVVADFGVAAFDAFAFDTALFVVGVFFTALFFDDELDSVLGRMGRVTFAVVFFAAMALGRGSNPSTRSTLGKESP